VRDIMRVESELLPVGGWVGNTLATRAHRNKSCEVTSTAGHPKEELQGYDREAQNGQL